METFIKILSFSSILQLFFKDAAHPACNVHDFFLIVLLVATLVELRWDVKP